MAEATAGNMTAGTGTTDGGGAAMAGSSTRVDRVMVGALSGLILLSALVYAGASLTLSTQVSWLQLAFESVTAAACVFGMLFATGKFRWAPAMAMLCVGGTVLVTTLLVYRGMLGEIQVEGRDRGWSLKPWLAGRLLASLALIALASWRVVSRHELGKKSFLRGVIASVPLMVCLGAGYYVWTLRDATPEVAGASPTATPNGVAAATPSTSTASAVTANGSANGLPGWASTGLLVIFGVGAGISLCAAGHYFIRAHEIGADVAEGRKVVA